MLLNMFGTSGTRVGAMGTDHWACKAPDATLELSLDNVFMVDKLLEEHDLPERSLQAVQGASGHCTCLCSLRMRPNVYGFACV